MLSDAPGKKEADEQIDFNIRIHNKLHKSYNDTYSEIFNDVEQERLARSLSQAKEAILSKEAVLRAMDYGCGTGNLTRHLLELGFDVISADVSPGLLKHVKETFSESKCHDTHQLNGRDLGGIEDGSFDLVAVYSVLHHIPDYLAALREMIRVIKPGGVLYIDHEAPDEYWDTPDEYKKFTAEMTQAVPKPRKTIKRFFKIAYYTNRYHKMKDPRFQSAGDIHVWPDDHIEWEKIKDMLNEEGFEVLAEDAYLGYRREYNKEIFDRFKDACIDSKLIIAKKKIFE